MSIRFGSLFTGYGGLDLGLEAAGLECQWQVEIDDDCNRVLETRWPGRRRHRDARTFPTHEGDWNVELIVGGDPCQENSRQRISRGTLQPSLGAEFIRIIDELRPRLVLRENPSQLRPDAPWPWWRFRDELRRMGYCVFPFRLRACCLGADHRRERMFLLASLPDSYGIDAQQAEGSRETIGTSPRDQGEGREREWVRPKFRPVLLGSWNRDDAGTLRIPDGVSRKLVNADIRGYGNAVPPPVGYWIGRKILKAMEAQCRPSPLTRTDSIS